MTMNGRRSENAMPVSSKRKMKDLLRQKDNQFCADCNAPDPKWASANIGVFVCLKCCAVHRNLGADTSKVMSLKLDEWSNEEIDSMIEVGGNFSANSIYEAYIGEGYKKPRPDASHEERAKFIRAKYDQQEFLKPSLRILSNKPSQSPRTSSSERVRNSFQTTTTSSQNRDGMVGDLGTLKVRVIKGTNLAVRDMMTSDPYVILKLGKQTVQTTVKNSNLNPVWNEELMLTVPQKFGAMNLKVYDHDMFSADDVMGEAEVDLQPLITSAMAFGDAGIFEDMQIGKWLRSHDNALKCDSKINIIDGKVKQEVSLLLQNVESGELELELEWIPAS